MMPSETNLEEIAEVVKSENFNNFHLKLKRELGILEFGYKIEIRDYQVAQDDFPDEKILASVLPSNRNHGEVR